LNQHSLGEASFPSLAVYFEGDEGSSTPAGAQQQQQQNMATDAPSFGTNSTAMASVNGASKRKDADSGNAALPLPVANSTGGVAPEKRRKIFVAGDSPNGEPAIHLSLRSERN